VLCYYSPGGDTAMPGGLYAGLCYAFLVFFFFFLSVEINQYANYLREVISIQSIHNRHRR